MKEPIRLCVACRAHVTKQTLIRVVADKDGKAVVDTRARMQGRGAYICRNAACVALAQKRHSFEQKLKATVTQDLFEGLEELINE